MGETTVSESLPGALGAPAAIEAVAHAFRIDPSLANRPADELAARFGLEPAFFRSLSAAMVGETVQPSFVDTVIAGVRRGLAWTGTAIKVFVDRLVAHAIPSLVGTSLVAFILTVGIVWAGDRFPVGEDIVKAGLFGAALAAVSVTALVIHSVIYFRRAKARYALAMSGIVFACGVLLLSLLATTEERLQLQQTGFPLVLVAAVSSGLVTFGYLVFSMASTLIGGYVKYRQMAKEEHTVTRQELLARLFQIDGMLAAMTAEGSLNRSLPWLDRIRQSKSMFPGFLLVGILLGFIDVVGTNFVNEGLIAARLANAMPSTVTVILGAILLVTKLGGYLGAGFIGGRPTVAISAIIVVWVGHLFPMLLPWGDYGPAKVLQSLHPANLFLALLAGIGMGLLSGYAALIENQNFRQRRLRDNDPAALLAEKIYLTRRLRLGQSATTVMVVDVSKSTAMKASADPLKVEWSFREYQRLVEEQSNYFGGEVLNTAGDGAVVAFPDPGAAVAAAQAIYTELPNFNSKRNRLDRSFRLRIGIHVGETQAQLSDAPFNELIDIAAHIEQVCPVGGIAVSGAAVQALDEDVSVAELAQHVDGQSVHVVLDTKMDA